MSNKNKTYNSEKNQISRIGSAVEAAKGIAEGVPDQSHAEAV
jgi:hypothetical protein